MKLIVRTSGAALLILLLGLVSWVAPASAHTGFESSDPVDGAILDTAVETITLIFSGDAEPTGNGFEVLTPSGEVLAPTQATTVDNRTWTLRFEPPLSGGTVGVRWNVKAPDAHPIDGTFSFTAPQAPATSEPQESSLQVAPVVPGDAANPVAGQETEPATTATAEVGVPVQSVDLDGAAGATAAVETPSLDSFLEGNSGPNWLTRVGTAGRALTIFGMLVGLGGIAFILFVMRGSRVEVVETLWWVKRAGAIVVLGAMLDFLGQVVLQSGSTSAVWSPSALADVAFSSYGLAVGLRLAGGWALAGTQLHTESIETPVPVSARRVPVGVGAAMGSIRAESPVVGSRSGRRINQDHQWVWSRSGWSFIGAAMILVSFVFHGHTVSKGSRLVTAVSDMVHVAGAAAWAGGVLLLFSVLFSRRMSGHPLRARELAARFSVVATVAIGMVGLAGLALTYIILDSPSELWSTPWGRLLILKSALVGLALLAGGYNHRYLVPALHAAEDEGIVAEQFRKVVTAEAALMAVIAVVTAFLIGAAS